MMTELNFLGELSL